MIFLQQIQKKNHWKRLQKVTYRAARATGEFLGDKTANVAIKSDEEKN